MTNTMSNTIRTPKNLAKRLVSLLMVFTMLFGGFSALMIEASAKKTESYQVTDPRLDARGQNVSAATFKIKGDLWSRKKVCVKLDFGSSFKSRTDARFCVVVFDRHGWYVGNYLDLKVGEYFYLPRGSQVYTIKIYSYIIWYNPRSTLHYAAAVGDRYHLEY